MINNINSLTSSFNNFNNVAKERNNLFDSGVDLVKNVTAEIEIEKDVKANIKSIQTQDEMTKTILDIKA
ncbi:MAG: hypothetical protein HXX81_00275 [Campylobacterales bacterium]|nr:hypothetical protein [Campylobacterales bacterium]